jgi:hypothetical protein
VHLSGEQYRFFPFADDRICQTVSSGKHIKALRTFILFIEHTRFMGVWLAFLCQKLHDVICRFGEILLENASVKMRYTLRSCRGCWSEEYMNVFQYISEKRRIKQTVRKQQNCRRLQHSFACAQEELLHGERQSKVLPVSRCYGGERHAVVLMTLSMRLFASRCDSFTTVPLHWFLWNVQSVP